MTVSAHASSARRSPRCARSRRSPSTSARAARKPSTAFENSPASNARSASFSSDAPVGGAGLSGVGVATADATYGAIAPNDLLAASATPGFAMRAGDDPRQGTIVGKALEPWESGSGTIRVLVMSR